MSGHHALNGKHSHRNYFIYPLQIIFRDIHVLHFSYIIGMILNTRPKRWYRTFSLGIRQIIGSETPRVNRLRYNGATYFKLCFLFWLFSVIQSFYWSQIRKTKTSRNFIEHVRTFIVSRIFVYKTITNLLAWNDT